MARLRWKKNSAETGISAISTGPRGSIYHDGVTKFASVSASGGGWRGPVRGWYFVAGWSSHVPYYNSCNELVESEAEAKRLAEEYVAKYR